MSDPSLGRTSQPAPAAGLSSRNGPATLSERVQSLRLVERSAPPASWRSYLPWLLCAVFAACTAVLSLGEPSAGDGTGPAAAPAETDAGRLPSGAAAGPAGPEGAVLLQLKGNITAIHQIQVSPKVSGMVEQLTFKEGDKVKKGDVLAVLEKVEYQSDYDQALGAAAAARGRLETLCRFRAEEADQAKAEFDEADAQRQQLLLDWKRSANLRGAALSAKDYEQAESSYRAMDRRAARLRVAWRFLKDKGPRDEQIAAAAADCKSAEAAVVKARWRLDNCRVTAPITGTILTKKTEEGSIVNAAAFNIAASLCDLADLSELEVDVAVPERDIAKVLRPARAEVRTLSPTLLGWSLLPPDWERPRQVWLRQKCRIIPEAYPERPYDGYVSRVMPMADRGKGSVPVRVKIAIAPAEAGLYLRPDMGALVRFLNARLETAE